MDTSFSVYRIFSDENGESHFGEVLIPLREGGIVGSLSEEIEVKSIVFREVAPSYNWDFHVAPQKQYIILLNGAIEIETSDGEKRQFGAGDVLLVEDISGKGHRTRNLIATKRKSIFILLQ